MDGSPDGVTDAVPDVEAVLALLRDQAAAHADASDDPVAAAYNACVLILQRTPAAEYRLVTQAVHGLVVLASRRDDLRADALLHLMRVIQHAERYRSNPRRHAVRGIAVLTYHDDALVQPTLQLLYRLMRRWHEKSHYVRKAVYTALSRLGRRFPGVQQEVLPMFTEFLDERTRGKIAAGRGQVVHVQTGVLVGLGRLTQCNAVLRATVAPLLIAGCRDVDFKVRWASLKALGHACCPLGDTPGDDELGERCFALARELMHTGGADWATLTGDPFTHESVFLVQYGAMQALGLLLRSAPDRWWSRVSPLLTRVLVSKRYAVRVKASVLMTMGKLAYVMPQANPFLRSIYDTLFSLAEFDNEQVAEPACYALVNASINHPAVYPRVRALIAAKLDGALACASPARLTLYLKHWCKLVSQDYQPVVIMHADVRGIKLGGPITDTADEYDPGAVLADQQQQQQPHVEDEYDPSMPAGRAVVAASAVDAMVTAVATAGTTAGGGGGAGGGAGGAGAGGDVDDTLEPPDWSPTQPVEAVPAPQQQPQQHQQQQPQQHQHWLGADGDRNDPLLTQQFQRDVVRALANPLATQAGTDQAGVDVDDLMAGASAGPADNEDALFAGTAVAAEATSDVGAVSQAEADTDAWAAAAAAEIAAGPAPRSITPSIAALARTADQLEGFLTTFSPVAIDSVVLLVTDADGSAGVLDSPHFTASLALLIDAYSKAQQRVDRSLIQASFRALWALPVAQREAVVNILKYPALLADKVFLAAVAIEPPQPHASGVARRSASATAAAGAITASQLRAKRGRTHGIPPPTAKRQKSPASIPEHGQQEGRGHAADTTGRRKQVRSDAVIVDVDDTDNTGSSTAVCRNWLAGRCYRGDQCRYLHVGQQQKQQEPCRYFSAGTCRKGDQCLYRHDPTLNPCKFFVTRGFCTMANCRFPHVTLTPGQRVLFLQRMKQQASEPAAAAAAAAAAASQATVSAGVHAVADSAADAGVVTTSTDTGDDDNPFARPQFLVGEF